MFVNNFYLYRRIFKYRSHNVHRYVCFREDMYPKIMGQCVRCS